MAFFHRTVACHSYVDFVKHSILALPVPNLSTLIPISWLEQHCFVSRMIETASVLCSLWLCRPHKNGDAAIETSRISSQARNELGAEFFIYQRQKVHWCNKLAVPAFASPCCLRKIFAADMLLDILAENECRVKRCSAYPAGCLDVLMLILLAPCRCKWKDFC